VGGMCDTSSRVELVSNRWFVEAFYCVNEIAWRSLGGATTGSSLRLFPADDAGSPHPIGRLAQAAPSEASVKARRNYRHSTIHLLTACAWRLLSSMALTSWKAFQFFSKTELPVPADEDGCYPFDVRIAVNGLLRLH
jgi:hypothetical protein